MQAIDISLQLQKTYTTIKKTRRSHDIQYKATHKMVALALYKEARKILKREIPPLIRTSTFWNVAEQVAVLSFLWLLKS